MRTALGLLLAAVSPVLSLFHIYWALGGRVGSGATVPVVGGKQTFNPSPAGTLLVDVIRVLAELSAQGAYEAGRRVRVEKKAYAGRSHRANSSAFRTCRGLTSYIQAT